MVSSVPSGKRVAVSAALILGVSAAVFVPWRLTNRTAQAQRPTGNAANPQNNAASKRAKYPWEIQYEAQKKRQEDANAAIASGNTKLATGLAQQMLKNNTDTRDWNYGNIIHQANQILGLAALQEGRIDDAKKFLIAAGNTPGSPQLDSFGPNMVLAQRLLEKGESGTVVQYLDLVARFWAHSSKDKLARLEKSHAGAAAQAVSLNQSQQKWIDLWKRQIAAGQTPQLNLSAQLY